MLLCGLWKNQRENKITDLSLLPPCTAVLQLHATSAVAYLRRNSENPRVEFPSLEESGWTSTGEIVWLDDSFPSDVEELLTSEDDCDEEEDSNDEYELGSDVDSEDELD